jgi:hypothetical protein
MKKLLAIMLMLLPMLAWGQKIARQEVDKFTKQSVIETSSEKIADFNKWKSLIPDPSEVVVSIRNVDGAWIMPTSIRLDEIQKYTEEDGITLLLENDATIILKTLYTGIGAESVGLSKNRHAFNTAFELTNEEVDNLRTNNIIAVRVSYLGGHKDFECNKSKGEKVKKMIKLIDDALSK